MKLSGLYNGISYVSKMTSFYWNLPKILTQELLQAGWHISQEIYSMKQFKIFFHWKIIFI